MAEKVSKYRILALEISRIPNSETRVIQIVISALGEMSLFTDYLALIGVMTRKSGSIQQTAVLV